MRISYSPAMSYPMTNSDSSINSSVVLEEVNEEKVLVFGVLANTLKPSPHCQRAAVKATQVLELIRRLIV